MLVILLGEKAKPYYTADRECVLVLLMLVLPKFIFFLTREKNSYLIFYLLIQDAILLSLSIITPFIFIKA